ncbi:MAG: VWA domain-containing protein, partial [Planctomycetaceae bacterium]|nr:VWA domain-containing protein [Planctomycetaceae bacterium]
MSVVTSQSSWGSSTPVDPYQQYYDDVAYDDPLLAEDGDEGRGLSPFISAFLLSTAINLGLMVMLATVYFDPPPEPLQIIASVSFDSEEEVDDKESPIQIFRFTKEELPETGSPSVVGIDVPVSSANQVNEVTSLRTEDRPVELAKFEAPIAVNLSQAPNYTSDVRIKGNAGVGAVGAIGAVDRITQEILLSLEERPTLVVWFFDKSWSMLPQRTEINQRFERVYREIGLSHLTATSVDQLPLLTSVVSFGAEYEYRHPSGVHKQRPMLTNQLSDIQAAVSSIENDPSGVESTFSSIIDAADKLKVFRHGTVRRNIMFVVFTDEVGDDEQRLEEAVTLCRNNAIRVYVVGTPAPFGRRNIEFKYVDPDPNYDQSVQWLPVRAGPETLRPEMVNLGFSGFTARDSTIYRLDSGFGPFSLTRLAYETGGIFF